MVLLAFGIKDGSLTLHWPQLPFVDIHDTASSINDVYVDGFWHLDRLYTIPHDELKHHIQSLAPSLVVDVPDKWTWQAS